MYHVIKSFVVRSIPPRVAYTVFVAHACYITPLSPKPVQCFMLAIELAHSHRSFSAYLMLYYVSSLTHDIPVLAPPGQELENIKDLIQGVVYKVHRPTARTQSFFTEEGCGVVNLGEEVQ